MTFYPYKKGVRKSLNHTEGGTQTVLGGGGGRGEWGGGRSGMGRGEKRNGGGGPSFHLLKGGHDIFTLS